MAEAGSGSGGLADEAIAAGGFGDAPGAALLFDVAVSVTLDQQTPVAVRQFWPNFNSWSFEIARFLRDTVFGFWFAVALLAVRFLLLIMFSHAVDRA